MAADPPTASCALATKLWVTVLVMEGARGFSARTAATARAMDARRAASSPSGKVGGVAEWDDSAMAAPLRKPGPAKASGRLLQEAPGA